MAANHYGRERTEPTSPDGLLEHRAGFDIRKHAYREIAGFIAAFEYVAGDEPIISAVVYREVGWDGKPREESSLPMTWKEACEHLQKVGVLNSVAAWTWTRVLIPVEKKVYSPDESGPHPWCWWCVAVPRMPDRFMPPKVFDVLED